MSSYLFIVGDSFRFTQRQGDGRTYGLQLPERFCDRIDPKGQENREWYLPTTFKVSEVVEEIVHLTDSYDRKFKFDTTTRYLTTPFQSSIADEPFSVKVLGGIQFLEATHKTQQAAHCVIL